MDRFQKRRSFDESIIKLFTDSNLESCNEKSYQIAEPYLTKNVAKQWKKLVEELVND